jgi:tripartite-type tricarboxylate transporter receptor subunit TctC
MLGLVRSGIVVALIIGAGVMRDAAAQTWPNHAVKIIMPLPTGAGADVTARIYADRLSKLWGQPVVVENRPGADGIIAVSGFVKAHDDHMLLFSYGGPITISPAIMPYDPGKDLVPITVGTENVLGIAATANLPFSTLKELEDYARQNPGKINWTATAGLPQFIFASFAKSRGLDMSYVAYKEAGPGLQDLVKGRIQINVTGVGTFRPVLQSGEAKLLAVLNRERFSASPRTPTVAEAGYPDLTGDGFNGFFGASDMKADIRDRIAANVATVAAELKRSDQLAALGQTARADGPVAFRKMIADQRVQVDKIIAMLGGPPGQ